jgi:SAM-dependent methyltransferase
MYPMTCNTPAPPIADPAVPDWASLELPDTRADDFDFRKPTHVIRVLGEIFARKRKPVLLPSGVPKAETIPKYVLQEFHNVPNGNYSKKLSRGYITGFDRAMLGTMELARKRLAGHLEGCASALDAGCAGGKTAAAILAAGVPDVWGIDPSPYLLSHAAADSPQVHFVQGLVEATEFPSERFDGIAACFLFHELPALHARKALTECLRILRPGGLLTICEPSPLQLEQTPWQSLRSFGPKGFYFSVLARWAHEPFVNAWHKIANQETFEAHGFECLEDEVGMPLRFIQLRKPLR